MRLENLVYTNQNFSKTRPTTGKSTGGHNSALRTKTIGRKKLNKSKELNMNFQLGNNVADPSDPLRSSKNVVKYKQ
jgi:hypothetical protein